MADNLFYLAVLVVVPIFLLAVWELQNQITKAGRSGRNKWIVKAGVQWIKAGVDFKQLLYYNFILPPTAGPFF